LLTGLGPAPLRSGDVVPIGDEPTKAPAVETPAAREERPLRVYPGPRDDWFDAAALTALTTAAWRVTPASNRVGIRLQRRARGRSRHGELLSEGLVTGAIQVPSNGQPILLLNDHPTT